MRCYRIPNSLIALQMFTELTNRDIGVIGEYTIELTKAGYIELYEAKQAYYEKK
ncbi:MAG: hypothetical protein O2887_17455 [Bacteroidetes bacterium]|nr:hypothetical protein [Bacteroidota bacterium]MDA1122245.1 hypothetical protein [Bacteroidota bacterium]